MGLAGTADGGASNVIEHILPKSIVVRRRFLFGVPAVRNSGERRGVRVRMSEDVHLKSVDHVLESRCPSFDREQP